MSLLDMNDDLDIVVDVDQWDEPTKPWERNAPKSVNPFAEDTTAFLTKCEENFGELERLRKQGRTSSGEYSKLIHEVRALTRARANVLGIKLKAGGQ